MERWKEIDGYEGLYEVSDFGRVRSMERTITQKAGKDVRRYPSYVRIIKSRILKPGWVGRKGCKTKYAQVLLSYEGKNDSRMVAVLVAKAFVPNPDSLPQVNHKDLDKSHNAASNLEWTTAEGNSQHAIANGHWPDQKGESNGGSKLTKDQVDNIRTEIALGVRQRILANRFGVSQVTISDIHRGKSWNCV